MRTAAILPAGFELQSVELWWFGIATEDRPAVANDWVLLRYGDDAGNWLLISQGFGPPLPRLTSTAPSEVERETMEVRGAEAEWFDGSPLGTRWEPGTMRVLDIEAGRVGGGWAIGPDGEALTGSPLRIALASNGLSVSELVEIAEGLDFH